MSHHRIQCKVSLHNNIQFNNIIFTANGINGLLQFFDLTAHRPSFCNDVPYIIHGRKVAGLYGGCKEASRPAGRNQTYRLPWMVETKKTAQGRLYIIVVFSLVLFSSIRCHVLIKLFNRSDLFCCKVLAEFFLFSCF